MTWETRMLKLPTPSSRARQTAIALAGAVVSKPTAKNTTCLVRDCRCAISSASSGEYTTRTSPPRARTCSRSHSLPGTRSMSPKRGEDHVRVGPPGASALSICSSGVTQTGQPGPWIISTASPSSSSSPCRTMVWVWPPQTSMSTQRPSGQRPRILAIRPRATAASRYSLEIFHERSSLRAPGFGSATSRIQSSSSSWLISRQRLEGAARLRFIHLRDREAHVHDRRSRPAAPCPRHRPGRPPGVPRRNPPVPIMRPRSSCISTIRPGIPRHMMSSR